MPMFPIIGKCLHKHKKPKIDFLCYTPQKGASNKNEQTTHGHGTQYTGIQWSRHDAKRIPP
jgi:hypothetical protein